MRIPNHKLMFLNYHPEGDGISERQIQTMKGLFRTKLNAEHMPVSNWPELLPEVQLAMNNKRHASTKHSPAELMFGNKLRRGELAVTIEDQITPPSCSLSDSQHESKINKDMDELGFILEKSTKAATQYESKIKTVKGFMHEDYTVAKLKEDAEKLGISEDFVF